MTKSELVKALANRQKHLAFGDIALGVRTILDMLSNALAAGERIEIRGFGSFTSRFRSARIGRNPKTGTTIWVPGKYVPHFKVGNELRNRLKGLSRSSTEHAPSGK